MMTKNEAIAEIVILAKKHQINIDELIAALGRQEIERNQKDRSTLTRVFSFLGGIFILFGLVTYTAIAWPSLNAFSRILITLGVGFICFILAVVGAVQNRQAVNVTALVILSALLQSTGLFVAALEILPGGGNPSLLGMSVFGILALQYGVIFFKLKRSSFLFFTIYFAVATFVCIADLIHIQHNLIEFICGTSLIALSYGIHRTAYNSICGFGYFIGSIVLLWMSFDLIRGSSLEVAYLGIACFMIYLSTIVHSRSMLAISTIAMFAYLSYFTHEHFLNSMGWPLFLILMGFIFFGLSTLTLKINNYISSSNE